MKANTMILSACAFTALAFSSSAQDQRPDGPPRGRPGSPIMAALDANKDGELDATEIANAAAALKTLDKNGDGKLSGDEIRPARGPGGPGGPGGRGPGQGGRPGGGAAGEKKAAQ